MNKWIVAVVQLLTGYSTLRRAALAVATIAGLSGCAALSALSYIPAMDGKGNRITGVVGQKAEISVYDKESCSEIPRRVLGDEKEASAFVSAVAVAAVSTGVELIGAELASMVAKLEKAATKTYSENLFLTASELRSLLSNGCLEIKRLDKESGNVTFVALIQSVQRGRKGVSLELVGLQMVNSLSETQHKYNEPVRVDLAVSVAIKAIRGRVNNSIPSVYNTIPTFEPIGEGVLTKSGVALGGDTFSCIPAPRNTPCPHSDLVPIPEAEIDMVSLGVAVTERGSFSSLDLAQMELKTIGKALGAALGKGVEARLD